MNKNKSKKSSIIWLFSISILAVGLLFFCQFYFGDVVNSESTYYENTRINGVNVSGLTVAQAENYLSSQLTNYKNSINITLKHQDSTWQINGEDLSYQGNIQPTLNQIINYGRDGNVFSKRKKKQEIEENGLEVNIAYENLFGGMQDKLENIIAEIEESPQQATIVFSPESKELFSLNQGKNGLIVDRDALNQEINNCLNQGNDYVITIPTKELILEEDVEGYFNSITKRASFSTDYSKSSTARKHNIKTALAQFNGMISEPGQEVSFNKTTGPRTSENNYKSAKIIYNGAYIDGVGGGVCQASTTLYNALLLADVEIIQVHHHTLPASYVPLSFDAMVSEDYADLVFRNNLDTPIYIKASCTDKIVSVEVYGQPFEEGLSIQTRTELLNIIPHKGDDIITDNDGKYQNQVLYKGEYYRLKYPQEGYESKGYIQYYKNGELVEEKEIRHDKYQSQNGIIIEGSALLEDGMTLPSNNVKYIPPQKLTKDSLENAKIKLKIK